MDAYEEVHRQEAHLCTFTLAVMYCEISELAQWRSAPPTAGRQPFKTSEKVVHMAEYPADREF
ncbi:hypothetical protein FHS01_001650 [Longimicrobium terrae]|uniref:Uncharacterized protein n=1 Tax=Longimicrobium terrae TaxID=1639882 RepID=A0A841GR38_9BACT|nr:hypothetical protein [Longimicrobium terrae]MBB6070032.1 hypothetical protein [Longimicrobium terrae]